MRFSGNWSHVLHLTNELGRRMNKINFVRRVKEEIVGAPVL